MVLLKEEIKQEKDETLEEFIKRFETTQKEGRNGAKAVYPTGWALKAMRFYLNDPEFGASKFNSLLTFLAEVCEFDKRELMVNIADLFIRISAIKEAQHKLKLTGTLVMDLCEDGNGIPCPESLNLLKASLKNRSFVLDFKNHKELPE